MPNQNQPPVQNPVEIAREAFRRLATRRVAPTPDAYRDIYNEIAGVPAPTVPAAFPAVEEVLGGFATQLTETPGELAVLMLSMHREDQYAIRPRLGGYAGYMAAKT